MGARKRQDLELNEREFARLLELVDLLDEVQLLRLQCKVGALLGDQAQEPSGRSDRDTVPPPMGLGGHYTRAVEAAPVGVPADGYEELRIDWEHEPDDGV
jgi:hypothetical protein